MLRPSGGPRGPELTASGGWEPPTSPGPSGPERPGWGQPPPGPPAPPPPPTQQGGGGGWRNPWLFLALAVVLAAGAALVVVLAKGEDEAKGQTVRFQAPTARGPAPFTKPADVKGSDRVRVGSGPFGGTGSDLVCDRELLISSLKAQPDRLREWARVVGVRPTYTAVARYIRTLRPVTLTVDTRVTNHSFVNGRAVPFQAILQAGTAVLVDRETGRPVARCRCGNPLLEPVYIPQATCYGCPQDYDPPSPCDDYTKCWRRYPSPPRVHGCCRPRTPPPAAPPDDQAATTTTPAPQEVPSASFSPRVGSPNDTYTLSFSGFPPNEPVNIHLTRPDGVEEDYSATAGPDGRGSYTFPNTGSRTVRGTYNADVTNAQVIASAQVTVRDDGGDVGGGGTPPPEGSELQCDPPRSQLESEQCAEQGR